MANRWWSVLVLTPHTCSSWQWFSLDQPLAWLTLLPALLFLLHGAKPWVGMCWEPTLSLGKCMHWTL